MSPDEGFLPDCVSPNCTLQDGALPSAGRNPGAVADRDRSPFVDRSPVDADRDGRFRERETVDLLLLFMARKILAKEGGGVNENYMRNKS